ncbi:MAG: OprD family outer membrane porin [Pseudomonadota bacterium]
MKSNNITYSNFVIFVLFVLCTSNLVWASEYLDGENPTAKSVDVLDTSLSYGLKQKPEDRIFLGNWIDNLPAFLSESSLTPRFRLFSLDRNNKESPDNAAIVYGGELQFISGQIADVFSIGASYFTSQRLRNDNGESTLLLRENGSDINTLGKLYLDIDLDDAYLRLYRQTFDLPYVNKHDVRMIPVTHEGYIYHKTGKKLNYMAGQITQLKRRNAEGFISMAEAAGAANSGKGTTMAGANYDFDNNFSLGAINYYTHDVFNIFYSKFTYTGPITNEVSTRISAQFTHQNSIGDELIGNFNTNHYGIQVETDYRNAILTLAATNTGKGSAIRSPFGGSPGFLSLILEDFDRANETGALAGLSYDFSSWGLTGLSTFSNFAWGKNAIDTETGNSLPDLNEQDFTIDYKPQAGLLKGFWLRYRYARADFDGGQTIQDNRFIINYELPFH